MIDTGLWTWLQALVASGCTDDVTDVTADCGGRHGLTNVKERSPSCPKPGLPNGDVANLPARRPNLECSRQHKGMKTYQP